MPSDLVISRGRAKAVLAAILLSAGGELAGKTRLYKAFYHAHLWYFQNHPGTLTDWPFFRGPHGPALDDGDSLLAEMVADGIIARSSRPAGGYDEQVFKLLTPGDIHAPEAVLKAAE